MMKGAFLVLAIVTVAILGWAAMNQDAANGQAAWDSCASRIATTYDNIYQAALKTADICGPKP